MLFPVVEVTRSLSNLIKYTFVNFDKEDSYVIDYERTGTADDSGAGSGRI